MDEFLDTVMKVLLCLFMAAAGVAMTLIAVVAYNKG